MRTKPSNPYPVADIKEANDALAVIAEVKRAINAINDALNADIDALKAQAAASAAPLTKRLADIETGLLLFAEANKTELFAKKRSVEMPHGAIGYRKSTVVKPMPKVLWSQVLGALTDLGMDEAIRVRRDVDKDVLRSWPPERLALVKARLEVKDVFWAEPAAEELEKKAS